MTEMRETDETIDAVLQSTKGDIGQALLILRDKLSEEDFAKFKASFRHQPRHRDAARLLRRLHKALVYSSVIIGLASLC